MSPANDAPYYDTIITSEREDYTIREMPLNPLIEIIHGITEPKQTKFNQNYNYKFVGIPNPFGIWSRQYLAKWLIEDDKFYLTELEGEIYGVTLTPQTFFIRLNSESDSIFKQLATWYTGQLTTFSDKEILLIEQQEFVVYHRIIYEIEKGIVLSSEDKTFQEKYKYIELPF